LVLLAPLVGCDSEQPLQVGDQTAAIEVNAVNAVTRTFDVWEYIEDNNGDFQPDDGNIYLWCESQVQNLNPITLPWLFGVEIAVVRAGQSEREVLTSSAAAALTANVARYDTRTQVLGATPQIPPRFNDGVPPDAKDFAIQVGTRTFRIRQNQQRRQPSVNVNVMQAVANPLRTALNIGSATTLGTGQCSVGNPGPARIDGVALPYTLTLGKGDTVIVTGRMTKDVPSGLGLAAVTASPGLKPTSISATLTIDGRKVNVQGTSAGESISFSYTAQ